MDVDNSNFEGVTKEFTSFLASQGQDTRVLWVFREDVYSRKSVNYRTNFWLKLPLPETNEELAMRHFELGKTKGLGMALTAFASCEKGLCCSFIVPIDAEDAQFLMLNPEHVRYSFINKEMPVASIVRNTFLWRLFGLIPRFQHANFMVYLASKGELKSLG